MVTQLKMELSRLQIRFAVSKEILHPHVFSFNGHHREGTGLSETWPPKAVLKIIFQIEWPWQPWQFVEYTIFRHTHMSHMSDREGIPQNRPFQKLKPSRIGVPSHLSHTAETSQNNKFDRSFSRRKLSADALSDSNHLSPKRWDCHGHLKSETGQ